MSNEHRDRILAYMDEMYYEEGGDDESVGAREQGGVISDIPLTFGDIRWLRGQLKPGAHVKPIDPVAVEMILAAGLSQQIGFMTNGWVAALRRAAKVLADAHEAGMLTDMGEEDYD